MKPVIRTFPRFLQYFLNSFSVRWSSVAYRKSIHTRHANGCLDIWKVACSIQWPVPRLRRRAAVFSCLNEPQQKSALPLLANPEHPVLTIIINELHLSCPVLRKISESLNLLLSIMNPPPGRFKMENIFLLCQMVIFVNRLNLPNPPPSGYI